MTTDRAYERLPAEVSPRTCQRATARCSGRDVQVVRIDRRTHRLCRECRETYAALWQFEWVAG